MNSCAGNGMVRRAGLVSMAALFLWCTAAVAQTTPTAPEWKSHSYAADGFSAIFPSEPQVSKKDISTGAGTVELRSYIVEAGDVALFIGVTDFGSALAGKGPDEVLDGAKGGALENSKSHIVGTPRKITLGVYPGLEFDSEGDTAHFHARIYLVGTTLYQTLVVTSLHVPYAGEERFLDSFQLIARERN